MARLTGAGVLAGVVLVLGACGAPPTPPQSAPPPPTGSPSLDASPALVPSLPPIAPTVPGGPTGVVPTYPGVVPTYPGVVPTYPGVVPTTRYPPPVTRTTTPPTTPATSPPPGAPRCTNGPTAAQVIAAVQGTAGIPDDPLKVIDGPYCSGSWQFSVVEIAEKDAEDSDEELAVVTTGKPATLTLIEAGTDVCSTKVQSDAPTGIRVRACGA
ncbi:hypothetical protein L083_8130 [Actinoplanes sp. N902-109]|nr:hypothetical protein L083_8130 [Actinoplanes sp. N902-109]